MHSVPHLLPFFITLTTVSPSLLDRGQLVYNNPNLLPYNPWQCRPRQRPSRGLGRGLSLLWKLAQCGVESDTGIREAGGGGISEEVE